VGYADNLDFVGQNARRRKERTIRQTTNEPDQITPLMLTGMGYIVDKTPLLLGDYAWELEAKSYLAAMGFAGVVVERKTLADLRDVNRLASQILRMSTSKGREFFIVLIEYVFDRDRKRRWSETAILNAELSMQLRGLHVTRCDANLVAERLDHLYSWSQKRKHLVAGEDTD
jgi:ERCC4-type nuclease